jgi:spermidine synthase
VEIARNTAWFHYLADCQGEVQVVLGDARLQLERELAAAGSHRFDVLCLDAFSGDAIPAHLLTAEAFAVYDRHLRPGGVLAVHITNTYLDLYPVVRRLAEHQGFLHTRIYRPAAWERGLYRNCYMLLSKDADFIRATPEDIEAMPAGFRKPRVVPLWTDEYGSLLPLLL